MGFLKNMISDAVSEGIGKGIQGAVGKAVESAVKPAADKLAGQAAESMNQAASDLAQSTQEAKTAMAEAGVAAGNAASASQAAAGTAAGQTAAASSGFANLGAALSGWASHMETAAANLAQNMKECPNCGEVVTADHKFCPKCGVALPEESIGAGYVCPKCGKQNLPETVYCTECGEMLPAAKAANEAQLAKWDEWLPCYPKWDLGGTFDLDRGDVMNGEPVVSLHVDGGGADKIAKYVEKLKAAGFVPAYDGDSDIYYKVVDGVCRAFDKTDADQSDFLTFSFFVGDYDKRPECRAGGGGKLSGRFGEKAPESVTDKIGDVSAKIGDAAGMFKGIFGKK